MRVQPAMENRDKDHLLALKVMRLTRPALYMTLPLYADERDLSGACLQQMVKEEVATVPRVADLSIGEMLTLPQNFGTIYLGETFSSYLSIHNQSQQVVRDIYLKADLQTSNSRVSLSSKTVEVPIAELAVDGIIDELIRHEVKEIGSHLLVCSVSYTTESEEKGSLRKLFKFQVAKPLDVRTKFYNAEDRTSDEVFLEAQIQNITTGPLFMEVVSLEPSAEFDVTPMNTIQNPEDRPLIDRLTWLKPLEMRQYLYCLTPTEKPEKRAAAQQGLSPVGKLNIEWRTSLGDKGRLQTSPLQRIAHGYGDIRLTVEKILGTTRVNESVDVTAKLANCSERAMDLVLTLQNNTKSGLHWNGISGRHLGKVEPGETRTVELSLVATSAGLKNVTGIRLTDAFLKRTYEYDDVAQIFVYSREE